MPRPRPRPLFAIACVAVSLGAASARADIQDYEFRLLEDTLKAGEEAVLAVAVVHKPSGRQVEDAVIFARRMDMAPEGMPTMTADLQPLPPDKPGVYRFRTNLGMEGGWQLSLAAKVQGETGTLQTRLVLQAKN